MRLKVNDITFSYASTRILNNITFDLKDGEILSIVGPNGSGKTTLLKCVDRILRPQSGAVMIDGCNIRDLERCEVAQHACIRARVRVKAVKTCEARTNY